MPSNEEIAVIEIDTSSSDENDLNGDDEEYDVEAVLDYTQVNSVRKFRVRWRGYTEADDTWEPWENLSEAVQTMALDLVYQRERQRNHARAAARAAARFAARAAGQLPQPPPDPPDNRANSDRLANEITANHVQRVSRDARGLVPLPLRTNEDPSRCRSPERPPREARQALALQNELNRNRHQVPVRLPMALLRPQEANQANRNSTQSPVQAQQDNQTPTLALSQAKPNSSQSPVRAQQVVQASTLAAPSQANQSSSITVNRIPSQSPVRPEEAAMQQNPEQAPEEMQQLPHQLLRVGVKSPRPAAEVAPSRERTTAQAAAFQAQCNPPAPSRSSSPLWQWKASPPHPPPTENQQSTLSGGAITVAVVRPRSPPPVRINSAAFPCLAVATQQHQAQVNQTNETLKSVSSVGWRVSSNAGPNGRPSGGVVLPGANNRVRLGANCGITRQLPNRGICLPSTSLQRHLVANRPSARSRLLQSAPQRQGGWHRFCVNQLEERNRPSRRRRRLTSEATPVKVGKEEAMMIEEEEVEQSANGDMPEDHFEIQAIMAERWVGRELQFQVRWVGFDPSWDEWVPAADINAADLLVAFRERQRRERCFHRPHRQLHRQHPHNTHNAQRIQ